MLTLAIDGLIALVKLVDRAFHHKRATPPVNSPLTVEDAPPSGVGGHPPASAADTGGHPVRSTSELLNDAVYQLFWAYDGNGPAVVRVLCSELRLRAAEYAAVGD